LNPEAAETGRAGGVKESFVGSGGGVGRVGEGVVDGSLCILDRELWRCVFWPSDGDGEDVGYPG